MSMSDLSRRYAGQSCCTSIVVPVQVQAVEPEDTHSTLNASVKTQCGHLVEQVVELDLGQMAALESRTGWNLEVLSCSKNLTGRIVVPLVCRSNKVTCNAGIRGTIITTNIG